MAIKIKVKKLHPEAVMPKFALAGDAGMDLFSVEDIELESGQRASCRTGVAIKVPENHVGLVWDKSGPSHKYGVKTLGGVLDSNYTGELLVGLVNLSQEKFIIRRGQKIAQLLIQKIEVPEVEDVDDLEETNRGAGGFGSTGIS